MRVLQLCLISLALCVYVEGKGGCTKGASCWPTEAQIMALQAKLDPSETRTLFWEGPGHPHVCGVPVYSKQPLYGAGTSPMSPVYVSSLNDSAVCFENGQEGDFCFMGTRNNPVDMAPAFIAWPTTVGHIQTLVQFATEHDLEVCVVGTGHDFQNRHSCDGLLIRTSLFNNIQYVADHTIRAEAGLTFAEIFNYISPKGEIISSGWAPTVGIAGWSIGGGHGPFANAVGLGVDQLLGVELVVANGSFVLVNESGTFGTDPDGTTWTSSSTDLLWALRGGGGSTWGVLTALKLKTHSIPPGGLTLAQVVWAGSITNDTDALKELIDWQFQWSLTLGTKFSGLHWWTPLWNKTLEFPVWELLTQVVYLGSPSDPEFQEVWGTYTTRFPSMQYVKFATPFANWWQFAEQHDVESLIPVAYLAPSKDAVGGVSSSLFSREAFANPDTQNMLYDIIVQCNAPDAPCLRQELYQDLTGNIGASQPNGTTAISQGMRTSVVHWVSDGASSSRMAEFYKLAPNSYFSESAYDMENWRTRYWGDNADRLEAVKAEWDPTGFFWCRHCIGDTTSAP